MTKRKNLKLDGPIRELTRPRWERKLSRSTRRDVKAHDKGLPELSEGEVTQIGSRAKYRAMPRFESGERDVSTLRGAVEVESAVRQTFGRPARSSDCVRVMKVELLRENEYRVFDTRTSRNPLHASIFCAEGVTAGGAKEWWCSSERVTLDDIAALSSAAIGGEK